jgi:hypothetical protein
VRNHRDVLDPKRRAIEVEAREFKLVLGGERIVSIRKWDPESRCTAIIRYLRRPLLKPDIGKLMVYPSILPGGDEWLALMTTKPWGSG